MNTLQRVRMNTLPRARSFGLRVGVVLLAMVFLVTRSTQANAANGSWNVNGSGSWNTAANWTPNTAVPGTAAGDVVGLNRDIGVNATVTLNTNVTLGTLNIGDTNATNSYTLTGTTGGTLTFNNNGTGASLVQVSTGLGNTISAGFTLADNLTITASTTLVSRPLAISGNIVETGSARNLTTSGSGTVILSGANTYTGTTTVNAGILQFVNPASLYNGGTANWTASKITTGSGGTFVVSVGASNFTTGNVTTLLTNLGGLGGSVASGQGLGAGSSIGFDTSNAGGSFTVADAIKNSTGAGGGAIGLVKLGSGTLTLSGLSSTAANNYTGTTLIDQDTLVLPASQTTRFTGGLTFGAGAGSANAGSLDLSHGSAEFAGQLIADGTSASANTITIGSGQTLATTANVAVGPTTDNSRLTVTGVGAWNATVTTGTLRIGRATSGAGTGSTLDASGLATLNIDLRTTGSTGGLIRIGSDGGTGGASANGDTLITATTSTLKAAALSVQYSNNNATARVRLGAGSQVWNINSVTLGSASRSTGTVDFFDPSLGSLTVRAANGSGRTDWTIGQSATQSINGGGTVDLTGHYSDLLLGTLILSRDNANNSFGTASYTSTFSFDYGVFDATTVTIANERFSRAGNWTGTLNLGGTSNLANTFAIGTLDMANTVGSSGTASATVNIAGNQTSGTITTVTLATTAAATGTATGTLNISGGSTRVTNGITLANRSGATPGTAAGTLNITGGSLLVGGNIATSGSLGTITSTVTLDGGSLDMGGFALGTAGQLISSLNIRSGTLSNVGQINNGAGLQKTTAGTLVLAGSSAYTGGNQIDGGTLRLATANALGSAANALTLNSGTLDLGGQNATIGLLTGSAGTVIRSSVAGSAVLTANSASSSTFAGQIIDGSGIVGLSKQGAGSLTLSAANTYTGTTLIGGGTLALSTSASLASSLITVGTAAASTSAYLDVSALSGGLTLASNQTINGKGTILGDMVVGGGATVSPGNSTGLLTETGAVTFAGGGRYTFEINNATGTAGSSSGWDLFDVGSLSVTATGLNPFSVDLVTLTSAQTPGLADNFDPNGTYYWLFLDAGSAITTWDATAFQVNATGFQNPTSNLFTVVRGDESGVGGTDQQLYVAYIGVPEPGSLALAGIGIFAAGWTLYRRRRPHDKATERHL
jgi:autotransporter-associated beta strand protein